MATSFYGCRAGEKFNPSDRTEPHKTKPIVTSVEPAADTQPTVQDKNETSAVDDKQAEAKAGEVATTTAAKDSEQKAEASKQTANKEAGEAKTAKQTEAVAKDPTVAEVKAALKKEEFKFYVNNLLEDPEPSSVVYADKAAGKAELTVFYAYFKDTKEADLAIANLLESEMIGKAISFGAELEKVVDESGKKVYTVNLSSFFATARAELRQDAERIGLVLLYKKNDEVQFAKYFEYMGLDNE